MKNRSYSLQKISSIKPQLIKRQRQNHRLDFPKPGDSNIYAGVGKKHFTIIANDVPQILQSRFNPENKVYGKDILNVRDIEGTTPSVKPETVRNIVKAYNNFPIQIQKKRRSVQMGQSKIGELKYVRQVDSLQKMASEYDLKNRGQRQSIILDRLQTQEGGKMNKPPEQHLRFSSIYQKKNSSAKHIVQIPKLERKFFNPTYISNIHMF